MRRTLGIVAGVATHVLFAVTVWHLYWFLRGGAAPSGEGSLSINLLLASLFGVVHSMLLYPRVREGLSQWVAPPFYGLFYCVVTCASLLALFAYWRRSPKVCWEFAGLPCVLVNAGFFLSWGALLYSLWLTGLGYQTGWTPWWHWVRNQPAPRREFNPRGLYRWLRHPVYLSFLGLVWFTPVVTEDRALLIAVWTSYVLIGSWLKDRRLAYYVGDRYRQYAASVPGYPGVVFGPLGKIAAREPTAPRNSPSEIKPHGHIATRGVHAPRRERSSCSPSR